MCYNYGVERGSLEPDRKDWGKKMNGTMEARLTKYQEEKAKEQAERNKIRKYANWYLYSDVQPYEVVKIISEKTVEIRAMNYREDETANKKLNDSFQAGGFVGHFDNSLQKWILTSNKLNVPFRIRLGRKGWKDANGNNYRMSDVPVKHYDFNF